MELGNEGENFVLEFEKNLVKSFNPRLVNKVNYLGKTKGLGYDIISAEQHSIHFYIYRIYFTNFGTFISIINDPY